MKRILAVVLSLIMLCTSLAVLSSCGGGTAEIILITDKGNIDDKSFNQGAWEGVVEYAEQNKISHKYIKPEEASDAGYLAAIDLAVEAGATMCWYKYVGMDGKVVGIDEFGASAPAKKLFEKYGFTVDNVVAAAKEVVAK